ncbi:probable rRNA-processing protein EBP2 [Paramacrobiotus metropolitanus]|uniref:probable rRNA-processing protein EBP2 n=1 Tax=Paramacrobiotus metropolitanus TaxID=2943436 RepID=UPI0024461B38|nr:probable rRNA-processing protein EBP2 [Paramacrobiotus metropolitanus]
MASMKMKKRLRDRSESPSDVSGEDWEDDSDGGSDTELQEAFASGKLKPGLNYSVEQRKPCANNKEGLIQKLEEIKLDLPWIERLDLTSRLAPLAPEIAAQIGIDPNLVVKTKSAAKKTKTNEDDDVVVEEELDNVDDDFKRELRFYRQAQSAVLEAVPRLHALGIPTKRPTDYFAEMAKSDEQMKRIREKLISKQQQIELSEKAKKMREQRKYGKQVQLEVMKKRQEEKKRIAESVKKFRKGAKGEQDELDFLTELEDSRKNTSKGTNRHQQNQKGPIKKTGKQKYKDTKYGFGGQKKRSKYNTKDSADDVHGKFDRRKHGSAPGNRKGKKPAQKRPGKVTRLKMKSNKSKR